MSTPAAQVGMVKVTVRVDPPPNTRSRIRQLGNEIVLEIYATSCRVWDAVTYTDSPEVYTFEVTAQAINSPRRPLTDIPFFPTVYRVVSEQYAANLGNPMGQFLRAAVAAMEADLAVQDGSNVYFVAAGSRVKIGWSKKVAARMAQLQVGSPEPLKLLGVIPGGRLAEKRLHERFAASRLSGEWFDATPELLAFVAANGADLHAGR